MEDALYLFGLEIVHALVYLKAARAPVRHEHAAVAREIAKYLAELGRARHEREKVFVQPILVFAIVVAKDKGEIIGRAQVQWDVYQVLRCKNKAHVKMAPFEKDLYQRRVFL
jgi:hypothetical protein